MNRSNGNRFKRKIGSERATIMLPLNVVMVARIRGPVDHSRVATALETLRSRHPLLAVRVQISDNGFGSYVTNDVPAISIHVEPRQNQQQWISCAEDELRTPFPMETGPLVRCVLIQSTEVSELVLCAHHAISDGMSLTYLIRDILEHLGTSSHGLEKVIPPAINHETASTPPSLGFVAKAIIRLINRAWSKKNLSFNFTMMKQLHQRYWQKNGGNRLLIWQLSESETTGFVNRCQAESVTVNSALWTAFLVVQHEVQGSSDRFRSRAGLAISTRDKLNVPVGESFGFYASSHKVLLKGYKNTSFWNAAQTVHSQIKRSIDSTNPFQMLSATLLDPTLLDSLYFSKYGLAPNGMSNKLLKKMMWDGVSFGFAITNMGRIDIPTLYGELKLDAVYGPIVYSDVNEKTVGVITVGNRLSFVMSYDTNKIKTETATQLRDKVVELIKEEIDGRLGGQEQS
jgi:NRPS condensation-like uncharacterized protein